MYRVDTEHDRNLKAALQSQFLKIVSFLDSQDMKERSDNTLLCPFLDGICRETRIVCLGRIGLEILFREVCFICPDMFDSHELVHLSHFLLQCHS